MNEKEKSPPERARMNEEARLEAMRQCVLGMLDMAQAKANHTKVCSVLRSFEEQEAQAQIQLSKALDLLNLVAAEEALDGPEVLAVLEDMLGPEWAAAALPAANKEG